MESEGSRRQSAGLTNRNRIIGGDSILGNTPGAECDDGNNEDGDCCSAVCTIEGGGEGCTPGYWKQCQHFGSWTSPLIPDTKFSMMFGSDVFGDKTLLEVLELGGSDIEGESNLEALGRHAVTALLNAIPPDVSYDRTTMQVKMMFNKALANGNILKVKDILDGLNNQGCPIRLNPGDTCEDKDKDK